MKSKGILLLAGLLCSLLPGKGEANTDSNSGERHETLQVYAGLVGGIERMSGRRTDSLVNGGATTVYALKKRMLENNATLSLVGGFLWKFPPLDILMGPEFFMGRGNATSNVSYADSLNNYYSTDVQRKFFYGDLIRIGTDFCKDYFTWVSFGIDRSQFWTKRALVITGAPIGANIVSRTKGFNGFLFGLGLERSFHHVIAGLDLKVIQYRRQDPVDIMGGGVSLNLNVRPIIYSAALRLCYRF
jgi:hypothetical protein